MQLATTNNLDSNGLVGPDLVAFYEERAKGGVGVIVSEGLAAHPSTHDERATGLGRGRVGAYSEEAREGLAQLARAIHRHGTLLIGQVYHGGRQHHSDLIPMLWGPSAIPCPHSGGVPHEMTQGEIRSTVEGFAAAAEQLFRAGFDGVEIHGAQGHLIQEFVSPFSNVRTDDYGGTFENRVRFPLEIIEAVRERTGPDFIIGYRMGAQEMSPGGLTVEDAVALAKVLEDHGMVDYISVSQGNFNSIEIHTPDRHFPRVPFADEVARITSAVNSTPVVGCGRILVPEEAEEQLASGHMDMVGLCRALIVDPFWVAKARGDEPGPIRKCISCNQCWGDIISERRIACIHNPTVGRERDWGHGTLRPADDKRRIAVVGAGPGGVEFARCAAERGHQVTVFDKEQSTGGSARLASGIPGHEEIGHVMEYLDAAVQDLDIEWKLGTPVQPSVLAQGNYDAVVLATGATYRGNWLGETGELPVLGSRQVLRDGLDDQVKRVIIFDEDGYYQAPEVAEMLAKNGRDVVIVTRFWHVGREIPAVSRVTTLRALDHLGVQLVPDHWLARVEGREVILEHYLSKRQTSIGSADALVHIGHDSPEDDLADPLRRLGIEVHVIGDAYQPRRIKNAITEAHALARSM
jgi:2,4-dienoyl-CoA reductase-like NADH-dependent reductase (Old Yellow Enzyme family)/thioredoxin reductase